MPRKRKKQKGDSHSKPVKRTAVLCPEPTHQLIREFSLEFRRSMRVTADDLLDLGRANISYWELFRRFKKEDSPDPTQLLKTAWLSPEKKFYLRIWAHREGMDLPLYQALDDLIQLGAWTWHHQHLPKGAKDSIDPARIARDLRPDAPWRIQFLKQRRTRRKPVNP